MPHTLLRTLLLACVMATATGCATVNGPTNPDDPWEGFNRSMYSFNKKFDQYVFKPVA